MRLNIVPASTGFAWFRAGLRTCWLNRTAASWPAGLAPPDLEVTTLSALADWLDAAPDPRLPSKDLP